MSQTLVPGGNAPLNASDITIHINSGADIETLALRLAADGSPRDSGDFINSSQTQSADGSIRRGGNLHHSSYHIDLARQPAAVERILIACVASQPIARLGALQLGVEAERQTLITCPYDLAGRSETALVLGECYRRNGVWKFRNIAQGYNGGRQPLLARYGADNLRPAPAAAPRPSGGGVSLQKITLDQHTPGVSLAKQADYGKIRINLNWNQGKPGLLGKLGGLLGRNQGVDLDLGAFIRLQNGNRDCIQALGNRFGDLQRPPYIRLRGDDRTGAVAEGEWLDVNGSHWADIAEILVFTFIYDGAANWDATDGIVTLHVQGQQIETRLTGGDPRHRMCAIARLINEHGSIRVERINRYFGDHRSMDKAFGWGFQWTPGRK